MDPTHLHLLLNHFPTIGFIVGLTLFVAALIARSDHLRQASLAVLVMIALVTIPTYLTGNSAATQLQDAEDIAPALVQRHEGAAILALATIEVTGLLAWLALWRFRRTARLGTGMTVVVLVSAALSLAHVARAANMGGEIRHSEIRASQAEPLPGQTVVTVVGGFVRDTTWVWPSLETLHFIGLSLLIGVLLLVNLRMLGFMKQVSLGAVDRLLPWGMLGFALNTLSGMLFFIALPESYDQNPAFFWKILCVVAGGANVLYFTFDDAWAMTPGAEAPAFTKLVSVTALCFWVGVMYYGSMLPYLGGAF